MYRTNSPYGFDSSSYAGSVQSIQSNGYSVDDRSSQISNLSRPSAKSIYMQRKEYADSITKIMDKFHYRVEHLFTCDLDGGEVCDVNDCVERLNILDGMGRVWGQDMVLEVRDGNLLLTDIETKEELESLPLSSIVELKAVMDSCVYNSLLTATVKDHSKRTTSVFMFQCEDLRADFIKRDLERALPHQRDDFSNHSNNSRVNLEVMSGHQIVRNHQKTGPPPEQREWTPPEEPSAQWSAPDYDEDPTPTPPMPREEPSPHRKETSVQPLFMEDKTAPVSHPRPYAETDRNVDILNHIFNDIEMFMGQVAAIAAKAEMKNKKKKKKNKDKGIDGMPPAEEFKTCLHKIKYGFNLLGELNGKINNPSAPEFVHCLFSTLAFVVSHCPEELPPTIVAPLLEPECIRLLSEEATPEEDQLWQSLGDAWNIPSTKWPEDDEDIPTYTLEFYDGWQPPEVTHSPPGREPEKREPERRQQSQNQSQSPFSTPEKSSAQWKPSPSRPDEPNSSYMRVMYDFTARNNRELSIFKGEVVQLLDMSRKWWKVRSDRGEQGFVPNNILESVDKEQEKQETSGPPSLTKRSKPNQVKAWLEHKGFSKITVRCLGVLSGSMLLGMTREELKIVCPEEGGRVFFQLQNIKSAMALASEIRPIEP